jgi:protocatechuate 3,4-dioxygenase beta subunit
LVVEDHPRVTSIVKRPDRPGLGLNVTQTVFDQLELVDDWHCPNEGVIAVTDIEAGTKVVNRRRTATNARGSFQQQGVHPGPSEVGSTDKSVVTTTYNNHIGFHQRWFPNHQPVR